MQVDFVLFLRSQLKGNTAWRGWWPNTLVYLGRVSSTFEIFARAQSRRYFERLILVLGIDSKDDFDALMVEFNEGKREAPRWQLIRFIQQRSQTGISSALSPDRPGINLPASKWPTLSDITIPPVRLLRESDRKSLNLLVVRARKIEQRA
jgi:hypothetical protein